MTSDTAVRQLLRDVTATEPFYAPDVDGAIADGRRYRRRQRRLVAVVAAPVVAGVTVAGLALASGAGPVVAPPVTGSGAGSLPGAVHTTGLGAPFDAILDAVARTSPKGLTLGDLDRTGSLGGWTLDGNVDDGHGAARLYVVVAPASVGGMMARPCSDFEFRGGGPCSTHTLADGTTVTVQGPAGSDGYRIEHVVVVHPDGSAVLVEADNASIPPTPQVLTSADKKTYRMPITRDEPIYTTAQLTTLALAVDAAVLG